MDRPNTFKLSRAIRQDDSKYPEFNYADEGIPEQSNTQTRIGQDEVNVKLPELKVDLKGLHELQKDFTTLRASVWEATDAIEKIQTNIDTVNSGFSSSFVSLKAQLDRIELSLTPILELANDERRKNSRLESVLSKIEDVLNQ